MQVPVLRYIRDLVAGTEYENQVFVAGGWVRDSILGRDSKDIDLVITRPNGGIEFAQFLHQRGGASKPVIFPRFGTAKVNLWDIDIEMVMPRSETYGMDGRNPEVSFASLQEDAERRDFTINALYYNVTTEQIVDLVGGVADIKRKYIRTAINPEIIFVDDPLRMLRAVRFACRFECMIEPRLINALHSHAHLIQGISQERITDEISKILVSPSPRGALYILWSTGLLQYVMPEIERLYGVTQNQYHVDDAFGHTLEVVQGVPADLMARLAALYHDVGKADTRTETESGVHFYAHEEVGAAITEQALRRMRFPSAVVHTVTLAVAQHMRLKASGTNGEKVSDKALRKLRTDLGEHLELTLTLMHADNMAHAVEHAMPAQIPGIRQRLTVLAEAAPAKVTLPISGDDVMKLLTMPPGREIGRLLGFVREAWFDNPNITREQAIRIIYDNAMLNKNG